MFVNSEMRTEGNMGSLDCQTITRSVSRVENKYIIPTKIFYSLIAAYKYQHIVQLLFISGGQNP